MSYPRRRGKYNAKRSEVDGIKFASKSEADRYGELKLLLARGMIQDLVLQKRYPLHAGNGDLICHYVADFVYGEDGVTVVEDRKGFKTDIYKLKKKWFEAEYGIRIRET